MKLNIGRILFEHLLDLRQGRTGLGLGHVDARAADSLPRFFKVGYAVNRPHRLVP